MGVRIHAIKPTEFICDFDAKLTEGQEDNGNICQIYTLDFAPINHLTQFREGYWLCKCLSGAYLDIPCSTFNDFRRAVCFIIHDGDNTDFIYHASNGESYYIHQINYDPD